MMKSHNEIESAPFRNTELNGNTNGQSLEVDGRQKSQKIALPKGRFDPTQQMKGVEEFKQMRPRRDKEQTFKRAKAESQRQPAQSVSHEPYESEQSIVST